MFKKIEENWLEKAFWQLFRKEGRNGDEMGRKNEKVAKELIISACTACDGAILELKSLATERMQ